MQWSGVMIQGIIWPWVSAYCFDCRVYGFGYDSYTLDLFCGHRDEYVRSRLRFVVANSAVTVLSLGLSLLFAVYATRYYAYSIVTLRNWKPVDPPPEEARSEERRVGKECRWVWYRCG